MVVVVVIAILAAITIVSYNGITKKAEQTAVLTQVDFYEKTMRMYYETYGDWPQMPALNSNFRACLGENYPENMTMASNTCYVVSGNTVLASVVPALNTSLAEFSQSLPKANAREISFSDGIRFRGVMYVASHYVQPTGKVAMLYYTPDGNNECGRGAPGSISNGGMTYNMCNIILK